MQSPLRISYGEDPRRGPRKLPAVTGSASLCAAGLGNRLPCHRLLLLGFYLPCCPVLLPSPPVFPCVHSEPFCSMFTRRVIQMKLSKDSLEMAQLTFAELRERERLFAQTLAEEREAEKPV